MDTNQLNRNGNRRGMNQNSLKNLHPRLKGNNHAQKDYSITRIQRDMLLLPCPYVEGKTWAEWLAERGLALAGENATYYKELLDRLEGKVSQPISGDKENPLQVNIDAKGKLASILNRLASRTGEAGSTKESKPEGS